jgi:hypothetical protein
VFSCFFGFTREYTGCCAAQPGGRIPIRVHLQENTMMTSISFNPSAAFPPVMPNPFFDTWSNVMGLYRDAMGTSAQQLVLSSASIIQEHTLRAFMNASQACAEALAKNAMDVQQQSMARFAEANQKAMGMMGQAVTEAWTAGMRPAQ